jgi:hypothetical protein
MNSETLFQIVLAVAAAFALWNKQRRSAAKKAEPARVSREGDAMEAERRRRVQEDIRRKIAQRAARPNPPASGEAPPEPPVAAERFNPVAAGRAGPIGAGKLESVSAPGRQPAAAVSPIEASPFRRDLAPAPPAPPPDWLVELRDHSGVRRAILLREILSPPVGLR